MTLWFLIIIIFLKCIVYDYRVILTVYLGIWNYIEGIRFSVKDMNQRVVKAKENVIVIQHLINRWNEIPLFERIKEEGRAEDLLNIEGRQFGKDESFEKL